MKTKRIEKHDNYTPIPNPNTKPNLNLRSHTHTNDQIPTPPPCLTLPIKQIRRLMPRTHISSLRNRSNRIRMPTRNPWSHGRVGTLIDIMLQILRLERFAKGLALRGVDDEEVLADTWTARLVAD